MSFGVMEETQARFAELDAPGPSTGAQPNLMAPPEERESSFDPFDTGQGIVNELTKSFGLRYEGGEWSWSMENIGKSFAEDPIWTTLDYLLLAVPPVKWGAAAFKVSKLARGTSTAKRLYEGGRVLEVAGEAQSRGAKTVEYLGQLAGAAPGLGRAAELESLHGVPRTSFGRFMSNPVARRDDNDWLDMITEAGGADPMELRGLHDLAMREAAVESEAWMREGTDLARQMRNKLDEEQGVRWVETLKSGVRPADDELAQLIGMDAVALYDKQLDFRFRIHQGHYDLGHISKEVYEANMEKFYPGVWRELSAARGKTPEHLRPSTWDEGQKRLIEEAEIMTRVMDPATGTMEMAKSAMHLSGSNYFRRLASSAAVKKPADILAHMTELANQGEGADPIARAFRKLYKDEQLDGFFRYLDSHKLLNNGTLPDEALEEGVSKFLGWMPLDEVFKQNGVPGYLKRIPEEMRGLYIDPAVANDVAGMLRIQGELGGLASAFMRSYQGMLGTFKYSKTIPNPATQMRNGFGAAVNHHLTVGGAGIFNPKNPFYRRGARALAGGPGTDDYNELLRGGLIGSSQDAELNRHMNNMLGKHFHSGGLVVDLFHKMPVIGQSWIMKGVTKLMSRAERVYRWTDEVAKADAYLIRRDAWKAQLGAEGFAGDIAKEAGGRAIQDVAKYQPMFSQTSPFTGVVRNLIPFSSFTTEQVRVWKNAIRDHPHRAFFWNNVAETMSQVTGAMAGFSTEEIEDAKEAMPYFMKGKKMLAWPFRVEGKPMFLDMSYMIPLANISEAADAEASFFEYAQMDPIATNPLLNMANAVSTNTDAFSKREIEPRFAENQLGMQLEPGRTRTAVGLAEHALKLMLPPLVPPGYSGVNLMEWMRGDRHPVTGAELEQGALRTIGANILGLRLYEADVNSQMLNVRKEERKLDARTSTWWDSWKRGNVGGDPAAMSKAAQEIRALRMMRGDTPEEADKYLAKGIRSREPGKFRTTSTRQLEEVLRRSKGLKYRDETDMQMLSELMARYQERKNR